MSRTWGQRRVYLRLCVSYSLTPSLIAFSFPSSSCLARDAFCLVLVCLPQRASRLHGLRPFCVACTTASLGAEQGLAHSRCSANIMEGRGSTSCPIERLTSHSEGLCAACPARTCRHCSDQLQRLQPQSLWGGRWRAEMGQVGCLGTGRAHAPSKIFPSYVYFANFFIVV